MSSVNRAGATRTKRSKGDGSVKVKGKAKSQRARSASPKRRGRTKSPKRSAAQLVQPPWDWRPPPRASSALAVVAYEPGALLEQLRQRAAEEQAMGSGEPKVEMWRSRWDAKWSIGNGRVAATLEERRPRAQSLTPASKAEGFHATARTSLHMGMPSSHWDMVRSRVGEIAQW
jgi:hypothetical protein